MSDYELDFPDGTSIEEAAREASRLARGSSGAVHFDFNGVHIACLDGEPPESLVAKYYQGLALARKSREQQNAERIADAIVPQLMLAERDKASVREIIVREILRAQ